MKKSEQTGIETPKERRKWLERVPLSFLLIILLFFVCLGVLLISADWVYRQRNFRIDRWATDSIRPYISPGLTRFIEFITFFGSASFLVPATLCLVLSFIFIRKQLRVGIRIFIISFTSTFMMFFLKDILKRSRPIVPLVSRAHGYSFPSGHSLSSVVFYGMLAYLAAKYVRPTWLRNITILFLAFWILLIGISRVYLNVHYASDVLAGFSLGVVWLVGSKWILNARAKAGGLKPV